MNILVHISNCFTRTFKAEYVFTALLHMKLLVVSFRQVKRCNPWVVRLCQLKLLNIQMYWQLCIFTAVAD